MPPPKKIVITGPESTGKTTLARELARHFRTPWVREYSRWYLGRLERPYTEEDLEPIALGQKRWERYAAEESRKGFFCDTSLEVIEIWSRYKYGRLTASLEEKLKHAPADLYLLCYPDLPWEPDPLRENPRDREELFVWYERWMKERGVSYQKVQGRGEERLESTLEAVERLMGD